MFRRVPSARLIALIPLLVFCLLGACARNLASDTAGSTCAGMRFVSVSNHWNRGIDVYASGRSSSRVLLGTVSAGESREFALTPDQYAGYMAEGVTRGVGVPSSARSLIQMRYLCR